VTTAIESHLRFLYEKEATDQLCARILELIEQHRGARAAVPEAPRRLALTERDALLITYGDQVCETGAPPLRTLAGFLEAHLQDVVSGVHLLPFYPSSSDDGFAVTDFFAVDPALGTWTEVARISESFDLMFDAVFNHMSAQSERSGSPSTVTKKRPYAGSSRRKRANQSLCADM
jgi:sucrose phosphorylase